ncbi:MAG: hypothetical protein ACE5GL_09080, partial [Calditrichia bacterium]
EEPAKSRREIIREMIDYINHWREKSIHPHYIIRHMLGLFSHQPGNKSWKRYLSENAYKPDVKAEILWEATERVPEWVLNAAPEAEQQVP